MKRLLTALFVLPLLATVALAQPGIPGAGGRSVESHYFSIGAGIPLNSYPKDTRALIEDLESYQGVSRVPIDVNAAVYWPIIDSRTVIGPAVQLTGDHLSRGDESIGFNVISLTASARRYLTGDIGDGLFGRIDAGIASAGVSHRIDNETYAENGNVGFGGAIGTGWALAVSSGTSIELSATALYRDLPGHVTGSVREGQDIFEEGTYVAAAFGVAVLW